MKHRHKSFWNSFLVHSCGIDDDCKIPENTLGLGFIFGETSCWVRFAVLAIVSLLFLYLLFRLVSDVIAILGKLFGWNDGCCNALLKEENCVKLKKVIECMERGDLISSKRSCPKNNTNDISDVYCTPLTDTSKQFSHYGCANHEIETCRRLNSFGTTALCRDFSCSQIYEGCCSCGTENEVSARKSFTPRSRKETNSSRRKVQCQKLPHNPSDLYKETMFNDHTATKATSYSVEKLRDSYYQSGKNAKNELCQASNQPDNIKPGKQICLSKQSPVNIKLEDCLPLFFDDPLTWYSYSSIPLVMKVNNFAHTICITGQWVSNDTPHITGGPLLRNYYVFDKLVFKWGSSDKKGSEHATNSKYYTLERQLIFQRNLKFEESSDSKVKPPKDLSPQMNSTKYINSLKYVIVSSFYETFDCDPYSRNVCLDNILQHVSYIEEDNSEYEIPAFSLDMIQEPFNCNYFSYFGSLTLPPFSENVLWIIQPDASFVSKEQMELFRQIKSENGKHVKSNRRKVQPLNKRCIYLCC